MTDVLVSCNTAGGLWGNALMIISHEDTGSWRRTMTQWRAFLCVSVSQ
jgi:hypothetical protein